MQSDGVRAFRRTQQYRGGMCEVTTLTLVRLDSKTLGVVQDEVKQKSISILFVWHDIILISLINHMYEASNEVVELLKRRDKSRDYQDVEMLYSKICCKAMRRDTVICSKTAGIWFQSH